MKQIFSNINKTSIRNILAVIIVLGCFLLLYLLQVKEVPSGNKDVLNIAVGFVFGGGLSGVCGYFFGSSKTDKTDKTD